MLGGQYSLKICVCVLCLCVWKLIGISMLVCMFCEYSIFECISLCVHLCASALLCVFVCECMCI